MVRVADEAGAIPADRVLRVRHGPQRERQVDIPPCGGCRSPCAGRILTDARQALEGLPVLRRLTVNGDERHDYLARGATLQIRDTCVYAVYGSQDLGKVEVRVLLACHHRRGRSFRTKRLAVPAIVGQAKTCRPSSL